MLHNNNCANIISKKIMHFNFICYADNTEYVKFQLPTYRNSNVGLDLIYNILNFNSRKNLMDFMK